MLTTIIQQPTELTLALLTQPLPMEVQVLRKATCQLGAWQAEFAIIGSSHYVLLRRGGEHWQEVLACLPLTADHCQHYYPCHTSESHQFEQARYHVTLTFSHTPTPPIPPNAESLQLDFPTVHGQTPQTAIHWQKIENRLEWWTLHTYPQAIGEIQVRTFSQFLLDQKGLQ